VVGSGDPTTTSQETRPQPVRRPDHNQSGDPTTTSQETRPQPLVRRPDHNQSPDHNSVGGIVRRSVSSAETNATKEAPMSRPRRKPADFELRLNGRVRLPFQRIESGSFRMGSRGERADEEPIHTVRITRARQLKTSQMERTPAERKPGDTAKSSGMCSGFSPDCQRHRGAPTRLPNFDNAPALRRRIEQQFRVAKLCWTSSSSICQCIPSSWM
jgi:hypothetical protein